MTYENLEPDFQYQAYFRNFVALKMCWKVLIKAAKVLNSSVVSMF